MPDSVVNWGILSTAKINHRLIPAIQSSDRGHLLGIASRNPDRASQYAEQHKIGRSYGSYADLISDPDIRAVYIPLPNDLHATWAINAMRAGKHVLLEKPFCMTMDEMDAIEQASRETGKTVTEAFMYLHHKQTHLIRSIIDSGKIGDIRTMSSNFCFTLNRPADNYRFIDRQGGGALWDVGVYPISMFQYLTDSEPLKVTGSARMANGVDLSYTGQMLYPGDITGQFFVSF